MSKRSVLLSFFLSTAAVVVAFLAASLPVLASSNSFRGGTFGVDISYPNKTNYPQTLPTGSTFGIVGVTAGHAFTQNSYLSKQYVWVTDKGLYPSLYMNLNYAIVSTAKGNTGSCAPGDKACQAYNYGANAAADALSYAEKEKATANLWWLDIETANSWSPNTSLNDQVIIGAVDYLTSQGKTVGIYSTAAMWRSIAGTSYNPGLPNWIPESTGLDSATMQSYCSSGYAFGGGSVAVVQYYNGSYDLDYACQQ